MNAKLRERFDRLLESVLAELPPHIHELLEETPLVVEDYPSDDIMDEMGLEYIDELCGLYTGIPLSEPESRAHRNLPDRVMLFREGVLSQAADASGHIATPELRRQMKITVLHEIGHHHGLSEDDLRKLGYA
ncbi:MAG: metallopeptidase family protein [Pirellulales bacterium]